MKKRFWFLAIFISVALLPLHLRAGLSLDPQPEPQNAEDTLAETRLFTDVDLEILLGPIALYPDPLLAVLLPAATHPTEIVMAVRLLNDGGDYHELETQPWPDTVKALAYYPEVIRWMDENLNWTTQLGQAFLYQPEDVINAIQRLRALAQSLGNLQTTPEEIIEVADGTIDILPANPDAVYVPIYDPEIVYRRPPFYGAGPHIRFRASRPTGAWLKHDWDWRNKRIVVWTKERSRPQTCWTQPRAERTKQFQNCAEWTPRVRAGKLPCKFWTTRHQQNTQRSNTSGTTGSKPASQSQTPTTTRPSAK